MLIANILGASLIGLIVWWFWLYKPNETKFSVGECTVYVKNGVYDPAHLQLDSDTPSNITFIRQDESPCSETVVFPELEISVSLPLETPTIVEIPALQPGDYSFHCQMQMYRGSIQVTERNL